MNLCANVWSLSIALQTDRSETLYMRLASEDFLEGIPKKYLHTPRDSFYPGELSTAI